MKSSIAIVISFYLPRSSDNLHQLLSSLNEFREQGSVVINSDEARENSKVGLLSGWRTLTVPNRGMNIGAWQQGFLARPDEDFYFFFQDECFIKKTGYIEACLERFNLNQKLGMLGESLNRKWDHSWAEMQNSSLNWSDENHQLNGKVLPRVDYYLVTLKRMGIDPGASALHLRSLCWAFRGSLLRAVGGFPIGLSKGECIAAEIGVSRKVLQLGYEFDQLRPTPFAYVGHREWKPDGSSKHK